MFALPLLLANLFHLRDTTPVLSSIPSPTFSTSGQKALAGLLREHQVERVVVADYDAYGVLEILVPEGARSHVLTTFRLGPGLTYDALHDAMKRRGYVIYAGQGDLRTYAFRVANMGTLTPRDMHGVVAAFAACLQELGLTTGSVRS